MLSNKDIDDILNSSPQEEGNLSNKDIDDILNSKPGKGPRSIEPSSETITPRQIALTGRNLAASVGDIADLPIFATNFALSKAGIKKQIPHIGNKIAEGIDTLTKGYTKPQNSGERIGEAITRGAGSLLSGSGAGNLLMKAPGVINKIGKGLKMINAANPTSLAATGAGAGVSQSILEKNPENLPAALLSGLAVDMGLRGARGLVSRRNLAKVISVNPKTVEDFKTLGVSPTLGQASNSGSIKSIEKLLENIPIVNKPIRNLRNKQNKLIEETLGPGALGQGLTEQEAGQLIHSGLTKKGKQVSDITYRLKEPILTAVKNAPSDLVDVKNSLDFFKEIKGNVKTGTMEKLIEKSGFGKSASDLEKMASIHNGKVPFSDVEQFRTHLLNEITKREAGTVDRGRLERLRGLLNKDIQPFMKEIGKSSEWNKYNKFYSNYAENIKPHVVLAKETPIREAHKLFDDIGHSGNLDRHLLNNVYASTKPSEKIDIMNGLIQKMGKQGDSWNPQFFAKRFEKQPKETQELFLAPLSPSMREKFKAVINSIESIKETNAFANTSRTAYTQYILNAATAGASVIPSLALGQDFKDSVWQGVLGLAAGRAAARGMFANPRFINWAYKGSQLKTPKSMIYHIEGIKGILGRPAYQEIKNVLGNQERLNKETKRTVNAS